MIIERRDGTKSLLIRAKFSYYTEQKLLYQMSLLAWVSWTLPQTSHSRQLQTPYQPVLLIIFHDSTGTCKALFHTENKEWDTFYFFGFCWERSDWLIGSSRTESNSRIPSRISFFYVYFEDVFAEGLDNEVPILMTKANRDVSERLILQCRFEKVILSEWLSAEMI